MEIYGESELGMCSLRWNFGHQNIHLVPNPFHTKVGNEVNCFQNNLYLLPITLKLV